MFKTSFRYVDDEDDMSALQDAIRRRRRILRFRDEPIPESKLLQVLDAGRWAPSHGDIQPLRMIIVCDEEIRRELLEMMGRRLKEYLPSEGGRGEARYSEEDLDLLPSAPVLVVACMTKEVFGDQPDRWMGEHAMGVQSVAAAIQNMLLVAHDVGLGGCWYTTPLFCPTAVRQALGIPQSVEPQAIVALGYPDEDPEPPRRKPFKEVIYLDSWGRRYPI